MKRTILAATILLAMLLIDGIARGSAPQQVPIVDDAAVSTPTATWLPSLLPTSTFTPKAALIANDRPITGYTVQRGDSVEAVAIEIGVDLYDMPCAVHPRFRLTDPLVIGDVLVAPEPGVVCHEVKAGETLASIAAMYGSSVDKVRNVAWNRLDQASAGEEPLDTGTYLRIPSTIADATNSAGFLAFMLDQPVNTSPFVGYAVGGPGAHSAKIDSVPPDWPFGSGQFAWPVYGWLSQGYRYEHRAVDVAAPIGTFVTASDRGVVIRAGWNDQGYGLFVVIDHNIDYVTLYGHLHDVLVEEGDVVAAGQIIGTVGSSGNSTGPHLHFEIRDFGRRANPLELINR